MLSWSLKNYQAVREAPKQENARFLFQAFSDINITSNRVPVAWPKLAIFEKRKKNVTVPSQDYVLPWLDSSKHSRPTLFEELVSIYAVVIDCLTCFQYQSYLFTNPFNNGQDLLRRKHDENFIFKSVR